MAVLADTNTLAAAKLNAPKEAARARNVELSIHQTSSGEEIAAAIDMAHASQTVMTHLCPLPFNCAQCYNSSAEAEETRGGGNSSLVAH